MWASLALFFLISVEVLSGQSTRFTNLECEVLDTSYCAYKQCKLKLIARGVVGVNIQAILLKGPFNNAKVNLSMWRKYNGFRPFMFNSTFDFCKFMAKEKTPISFEKIIVDVVGTKSNFNHTCPYGHDLIIKDLVFKEEFLRYLPLPSGEYKIQLIAGTDNEWKTIVYVSFKHNED